VALETLESLHIFLLKEKHVAAVGSRAPRDGVTVFISISLQSMLLILFKHLLRENYPQITFLDVLLAVIVGAPEGEGVGADIVLEGLGKTVLVEDMTAVQSLHFIFKEIDVADFARSFLAVCNILLSIELLLHLSRHFNIDILSSLFFFL
jgi:hypothetical protein